MIENRKFIRLKVPLPVEYRVIKKDKKQRTLLTSMKNICVGGLSLITVEAVRAGDLMQIQIRIPHLEEPVSMLGEVVWHKMFSDKDSESSHHEAGVRFQDANPVELNKILDYVYSVAIG